MDFSDRRLRCKQHRYKANIHADVNYAAIFIRLEIICFSKENFINESNVVHASSVKCHVAYSEDDIVATNFNTSALFIKLSKIVKMLVKQ